MKISLTVLLITIFSLPLFSQNPIIREEYFELNNNQWNKVSIVERAFDNQGILTNTKELYFDSSMKKWIPQTETWFDQFGNHIRTRRQFFIDLNSGFYVEENKQTYNESNQLLLSETYIKADNNSELSLQRREVRTYFDDCSYLQESYFQNGPGEENLLFNGATLTITDDNCEFITGVAGNRQNIPIERLRDQVRITYSTLRNGQQQRLVEHMTCPEIFGCDDFKFSKQETFNVDNQLIYGIYGAATDFFRRITTIDYQTDRTIYSHEFFNRTNNQPTVTISSREITTVDTAGNLLSRKQFFPLSFSEFQNIYNEQGKILQSISAFSRKDSTGLNVFPDTINYAYQYYCDGLISERVTDYGDFKSKITYSYLHPAECGTLSSIGNIAVFPNPATNILNVTNPAFINGAYDLEIYDNLGRFIRRSSNYRGETQSIDISDLPNGIYYLSIPLEKDRTTQRFVVLQ